MTCACARRLAAISILSFVLAAIAAEQHRGATNPLGAGWVSVHADVASLRNAAVYAPDPSFLPEHAWQISAAPGKRLRYQVAGPGAADSWTLSARLHIPDQGSPVEAAALREVANGWRRFVLAFGTGASLAALVPKPRINLTRFHGVLAPNSKYRRG